MIDTVNRNKCLISVPEKKLLIGKDSIISSCDKDKNKSIDQDLCEDCRLMITAYNRYYLSNIPYEYWNLSMDNFTGFPGLKKKYEDLRDIRKTYTDGVALCLAGKHGTGKTYACTSILKDAALKGYSALYLTLGEIISALTSKSEDKFSIRKELVLVDFLVIDEFDSRYIGSEQASDLYGRIIEDVLRSRIQNKVPLFMCTNNSSVTDAFSGQLKNSISSLMKKVETMPILGADFRGKKKDGI